MTNHLWQSTWFAVAAGILTMAFRVNRAQVRYWLWLSASLKFLVPFSLLMSLGSQLQWMQSAEATTAPAVSIAMVQIARPFQDTAPIIPSTPRSVDWTPAVLLAVWACGFGKIAWIRFRGWRRIRSAVRLSAPLNIQAAVEVRSSPGLLEPGVAGFFRPVLLLPADIAQRLTPRQLDAVLAHELCHVQRRDNLSSAIHMIVEAIFWFHPLVWWIGARLVEERERACDEAVLSLGSEPRDYAEAILNVCGSYLESPLPCVSGVTGSDLKKRIRAILGGLVARNLSVAKKLVLAAAGIAAIAIPIAVGVAGAPRIQAQSPRAPAKFEAVSIQPCTAFRGSTVEENLSSATFHSECTTMQRLLQQAYGLFANGHMNPLSSLTVTGGPAWTTSALYEIDAKTKKPQSRADRNGPMLQALLEDRFKLKVHRETREVPVYKLTVAAGGVKLPPFQGSCVPWDWDHPNPGPTHCGNSRLTGNGIDLNGATMADLGVFFLVALDRPIIDKTGLAGRFNFHLELPSEEIEYFHHAHGMPALSDPQAQPADPSLISAIKTAAGKLGLNLESAQGPGEFLVIDHVARPSNN